METDRIIVYPIYFSNCKSISEGRRVSSALATPSPSASLIHNAATHLGLKAEIENKHHPKDAVGSKRVVIFTSDKKNALLLAIAQELQKLTSVPANATRQKNRK